MRTRLKILALAAALAAGSSSAALAQYACPPGYVFYGGACQPMGQPGYSNPVSGAVSGEAAGAASGYRTGGSVGAVPQLTDRHDAFAAHIAFSAAQSRFQIQHRGIGRQP